MAKADGGSVELSTLHVSIRYEGHAEFDEVSLEQSVSFFACRQRPRDSQGPFWGVSHGVPKRLTATQVFSVEFSTSVCSEIQWYRVAGEHRPSESP